MKEQVPRRTLLRCLAILGLAGGTAFGGDLNVHLNSEGLVAAAPNLHFLQGKALDRLRDGGMVTADLQLLLLTDAKTQTFRRAAGRFVISYDLWEEKFAITRALPSRRSVSRLGVSAAETWCVDNLPLAIDGLAPDRDFWLRLELRMDDRKAQITSPGDAGISLTGLVEIFSRTARAQQPKWLFEAGPFRLANLRK